MNNVTQLHSETAAKFAVVATVNDLGMITHVCWPDSDTLIPVYSQANSISPCQPGDEVLLQHTMAGYVVIAVLAKPEQVPAADIRDNNGHIVLKAEQRITLKTAKGSIEVAADGRISLEGQEINAQSETDFNLAGWPIRLN